MKASLDHVVVQGKLVAALHSLPHPWIGPQAAEGGLVFPGERLSPAEFPFHDDEADIGLVVAESG